MEMTVGLLVLGIGAIILLFGIGYILGVVEYKVAQKKRERIKQEIADEVTARLLYGENIKKM